MSPFDLLFKKNKKRHPILGRRQGEQGWLEDGARLLKKVISSCDGRGCYPIRMFSAKEIEQAIGQPFHGDGFYVDYEGTHEDRPIIIKVYRIENRELAFNEIATVTQIKHANVAKLLGCCFEMEQPILIYEKRIVYRDIANDDFPLLNFISNESAEKEERLELILLNGLWMDVRQVEQAMACIEVAVGCLSRNSDERPAMKEVAQQLEQIERGELPLNSSSLLRVQQLATVGSSEGVSQIRTHYESESGSSEGVSPR